MAWAAFRSEILPADVLVEMDANLPQSQQAYLTMMDEAAAMRRKMDEHGERLQSVEERLSGFEARLVGTDFINSAQAKQYLDMVTVLGSLLKKKGSGTHVTVHAEVKRQLNVPSYQLMPEKDFSAVVTFLAG